MNNQEIHDNWLIENFLLDEIDRTPDQEDRLVKLYDYLQLMKEFDDEIESPY